MTRNKAPVKLTTFFKKKKQKNNECAEVIITQPYNAVQDKCILLVTNLTHAATHVVHNSEIFNILETKTLPNFPVIRPRLSDFQIGRSLFESARWNNARSTAFPCNTDFNLFHLSGCRNKGTLTTDKEKLTIGTTKYIKKKFRFFLLFVKYSDFLPRVSNNSSSLRFLFQENFPNKSLPPHGHNEVPWVLSGRLLLVWEQRARRKREVCTVAKQFIKSSE